MPKILWSQLFICELLLLFVVIYDGALHIFAFWAVKKRSLRHQLGLEKFSLFFFFFE